MKNILFFYICLIIYTSIFSQQLESSIATIGGEFVSPIEFKLRYETMPHVLDDYYNIDSVKLKVLNTFIAEKLWAKEAELSGIDTTAEFKQLFTPIEKIFVRDALFNKEILPKIKLTEKDHQFIRSNYNTYCKTDIYIFTDSASAFLYYNMVNKKGFNKLDLNSFNYEIDSTQTITLGSLDNEELENKILSSQNGDLFPPVKTQTGWFVLKLKEKYKINNDKEKEKYILAIKERITERRSKKFGTIYLKNLLGEIRFTINEGLFKKLSDLMLKRVLYKQQSDSTLKNSTILFEESDVNFLIFSFLQEELNSPYIIYKFDNILLKEFLYFIMFEDFTIKNISDEILTNKLVAFTKYFVEQDLITKEGYRQKLNNSPAVIEDLRLWKENILAQIIQNIQIKDISVTENETIDYYNTQYNNTKSVTEVNILEILTDKLDMIEFLMDQLDKGADFKELAKQYTLREWTKSKNGEFGFFPVNMYGEIGKIASSLKINEIFGPIKTTEGYSIIKLIDKKEDKTNKAFSEIKDIISDQIKSKKTYNLLDEKTSLLAKKYGVSINNEVLKNTKVSNVNMFTHRFMGFGGKIAAMPYTNPIYNWFNIYKKLNKESL
ncbi:MAG: peptidylprolyl isomerase [bacterium]